MVFEKEQKYSLPKTDTALKMNQRSRNKNESASKTATALEASEKTDAASDAMAEVPAEMKEMRKDLTER